jgi:hypothetical protein
MQRRPGIKIFPIVIFIPGAAEILKWEVYTMRSSRTGIGKSDAGVKIFQKVRGAYD